MTYSYNGYNSDESNTNNEVQSDVVDTVNLTSVDGVEVTELPVRPYNGDRAGIPPGDGGAVSEIIKNKIKEWLETEYPDLDLDDIGDVPIKDVIKNQIKEWLEENLDDDQQDQISNILDQLQEGAEEIKNDIKEEIVDGLNEWFENHPELDKVQYFKIVECHGGLFQLEDNVKLYDPANARDKNIPQFPNCDDDVTDENNLEFMYEGGWEYEDATRGVETGYTSNTVRVIRAGHTGMPRGYDNEKNNPYRYPHLPPRSTKMNSNEPKKFLWIHPFLERSVEELNGEPTNPIAFSKYKTNDYWQSGQMANGGATVDVYNGAGFQTAPGGKFSNVNERQPARLCFRTPLYGLKWIGIWGNSRGKEMMGYPDEPTEGLEYGCVGMSGWFTSAYNNSAGTITNGGIKFAYTMYRIDTGILEIVANVIALAELAEGIEQGEDAFGIPVEESQGQEPGVSASSLAEIDAKNYVDKWSDKDFAIISKLMRKFDIKSNYYKDLNNENILDIKNIFKRGGFEKLKKIALRDTPETHLALNVVFDLANHYMNIDKGTTDENDHIGLIDSGTISRRIEAGQELTLLDFFNHLITKISLGDESTYNVIGEDINYEEYAKHLLGLAPNNTQPEMLEFVLDMKAKANFDKFRYVKGELAAILTTGFEITFTHWQGEFLGWCDACMEFGGSIKPITSFRYACTGYTEHKYDPSIIEFPEYDVYECEDGEGFEDARHLYDQPTSFSVKPDYISGGTDPVPEERPKPEKGQLDEFQLHPEPAPKEQAQFWRGIHAVPSTGAAAQPDWTKWSDESDPVTGQKNMVYTYGPFKDHELDIFYRFITPQGGQNNSPRTDFGITWWLAWKTHGPWTQGATQKPGDSMESGNLGYTLKKVGGVSLQGKDAVTGEFLANKKARYFRCSFWQWHNTASQLQGKEKQKGPRVEDWMYPPGYKIGGKVFVGARMPRGLYFDAIVTPSTEKNLFEQYYSDTSKGPVYPTLELEKTLELHDYQHPYWTMNYFTKNKDGYYKIWGLLSGEQTSEALSTRKEPELMGIYTAQNGEAINIKEEPLGVLWKDHWKLAAVIQNPGIKNYVIVKLEAGQQVLVTARDSSRADEKDGEVPGDLMDRDWQSAGEPWINASAISTETVRKHQNGPAYWGELHENRERPNFYDPKWQVPLNTYRPDAYDHTPGNVTVFKGKRIELNTNLDPSQDNKHRTKYTYDVYFAQNDDMLDKIVNENEVLRWGGTDKPHFIYVGTLDYNDNTPFTITCPSDKMIFAARSTKGRSKESWWNDGERVQLICNETETPRDDRKGPAYWAFGIGNSNNIGKGDRGYVDFNNAYWSNPLNQMSVGPNGIPVKRGTTYRLTPTVDQKYAYRIIWGRTDKSKNPILYKDPNFGRKNIQSNINTEWYTFEPDENLVRPIWSEQGSVLVEAKGDQLYFGAFRLDTNDPDIIVDNPSMYEWSRYGEPVEIEIEEEPTEEGCSFWASETAHTNNTVSNLARYRRPLMDLVTEMKNLATQNGEDMAALTGTILSTQDDDGSEVNWKRTFEIHKGRSYLFKRTDETPALDYTVRFLQDQNQLSSSTPIDTTTNVEKNAVWNQQTNQISVENLNSDIVIFNAFKTNIPETDWSKKGQPIFLELYEKIEQGVINGKQYWTDWDKPDNQVPIAYKAETANTQLKNNHWTNPLNNLNNPDLSESFESGKKYKVWVDDDPLALGDRPCPNYMHVLFAEGTPQATNTGMVKDYVILGVLGDQTVSADERWSPTANFNGEENGCTFIVPEGKDIVLIGAWQTGNRRTTGHTGTGPGGLTGWNKDGENIKIKFVELPIEPPRGPVLWADHIEQRKDQEIMGTGDITEYFAIPHGGRGVNPALPTTNGEESSNPHYYEKLYSMGDNGTEIKPRIGSRYRFTPNTEAESWIPEDTEGVPYDMRWWFMDNLSSLDPKKVTQDQYKAGRGLIGDYNHVDVIIDERYMQFGAFNTSGRLPEEWSVEGEPVNHNMEFLPELPIFGPAYFAKNNSEYPAVIDPHFYKPLNYVGVKSGAIYTIYPSDRYNSSGGGKITVWFIFDDSRDSWRSFSRIRENLNKPQWPPIPIDPLHPEDMILHDETRDDWWISPECIDAFYEEGPTIDMDKDADDAPTIKIPDGCSRIFYGWYGRANDTLTDWNRDGEIIPFSLDEKEYGEIEGPLYWGDTVGGTPQFNNNHFEEELRFTRVLPDRYYDIEQETATSMDNYGEVDVYEFNPNEINVLDPSLNNLASFKKIATLVRNGGSKLIEVSESALIFSARDILQSYNKRKATDWSPKGEPSPFKITEATIQKGPVYYAESAKSWNTGGGQPDLSNLKWIKDPLESYKVPSSECEIYITKDLVDADYSVWYCESASDLKPGQTNNKNRWKEIGTFTRGTKKTDEDESSLIVPMNAKYIVIGFHNQIVGGDRTWENWSPFGEPGFFKFRTRRWGNGPGYPAYQRNTGNQDLIFDTSETRWEKPMNSNVVPKRNKNSEKFHSTSKYIWERTKSIPSGTEYFQLMWSKTKKPTSKNDVTYGRKIDTKDKKDKEFTLTPPPGYDYLYYTIFKSGGKPYSENEMLDFSPTGTNVPWKVTREKKGLPPVPGWVKIFIGVLAAIVGALLGFIAYFAAMKPLDVIMEMVNEGRNNMYPIKRKEIFWHPNDNDREVPGYNHPDSVFIKDQDSEFYTGMDNEPKWFNYIGDIAVRGWGRIMKLRHNGYMFHCTNVQKITTGVVSMNEHFIEFSNLTPTFSFNYFRLNSGRMRKAFRHYNKNDKTPSEDIKVFNPYDQEGCRVIQPDCRPDPLAQATGWDKRKVWFKPSFSYSPQLKQGGNWYPTGVIGEGSKYILDANYTDSGNRLAFPCVTGPMHQLDNIFSPIGAGLTVDKYYSSDSGTHAHALKILNGDIYMEWPDLEYGRGKFYPGIDFDLKFADIASDFEAAANWQIVSIDLNFVSYRRGTLADGGLLVPWSSYSRSLAPYQTKDEEDAGQFVYKFRDNYDKNPSFSLYKQLSRTRPLINIKAKAVEPVEADARLQSISFSIWIAGDNKKVNRNLIISNLGYTTEYE